MFLDDLFIIRMTPQMMEDFITFGYTIKGDHFEGVFEGCIHRFAVFCDANTGIVSYKTIKNHDFTKNLVGFKKFYSKISKEQEYKQYDIAEDGRPILNDDKIREIRYSL